jgi:hypothetical protein
MSLRPAGLASRGSQGGGLFESRRPSSPSLAQLCADQDALAIQHLCRPRSLRLVPPRSGSMLRPRPTTTVTRTRARSRIRLWVRIGHELRNTAAAKDQDALAIQHLCRPRSLRLVPPRSGSMLRLAPDLSADNGSAAGTVAGPASSATACQDRPIHVSSSSWPPRSGSMLRLAPDLRAPHSLVPPDRLGRGLCRRGVSEHRAERVPASPSADNGSAAGTVAGPASSATACQDIARQGQLDEETCIGLS